MWPRANDSDARCASTVEVLLEHQTRMLAQRVELDLRPIRFDGAQLGCVLDQHRRRIDRVVGHAVRVAVDESLELVDVVAGDPSCDLEARGLDHGPLR